MPVKESNNLEIIEFLRRNRISNDPNAGGILFAANVLATVAHERAIRAHDAQRDALKRYEAVGWSRHSKSEADAVDQAHICTTRLQKRGLASHICKPMVWAISGKHYPLCWSRPYLIDKAFSKFHLPSGSTSGSSPKPLQVKHNFR
jgi:hypothetical protein